MMKKLLFLFLLFSVSLSFADTSLLTGATPEKKEEPIKKEETNAKKNEKKVLLDELRSPRDTVSSFLRAMNNVKRGQPEQIHIALRTLDLSDIPAMVRSYQGTTAAWYLLDALDHTRLIDVNRIPNESYSRDVWVLQRYETGVIRLVRQDDGVWVFDDATVADIKEIWKEVETQKRYVGTDEEAVWLPWHMRFRSSLPNSLKENSFYLENWKWLAILLLSLLGVIVDKLVSVLLQKGMRRRIASAQTLQEKGLSEELLRPLGLVAMALLWWLGISMLGLPESAMVVLKVAVDFVLTFAAVWAVYRLVDLFTVWLLKQVSKTSNTWDDNLAPLVPKALKIFVTVMGGVFIADALSIDITGLLAGLGLGGLAFALAAKDMVQNLFGSITVLLDRTFSVGDWIVADDVEGTVEHIGFRSTRIRTFYNSLVNVPNSIFITAKVDNMGQRRYRRMKTMIGLTYDTPPDLIEAFCEGAREIVRQHEYMRKDYFHIYFNQYSASSLDILFYVFWQTPDWSKELAERHRFLLDILRLAKSLDIEFAYPTQTLYMREEAGQEDKPYDIMSQQSAMEKGKKIAADIVR